MTFRGRELLFTYFMLGLALPGRPWRSCRSTSLIRQLGLVDTLWGIILPQVAFALPVSVLILRDFFLAIPRELEDAAYVDGASPFEFFLRILLPLARPGSGRRGGADDGLSWNNFFLPLVVLNSEKRWTLPLGVMQSRGSSAPIGARVLAFVSLALVPAIIFYLFAERQIIAGLTAGSVKG